MRHIQFAPQNESSELCLVSVQLQWPTVPGALLMLGQSIGKKQSKTLDWLFRQSSFANVYLFMEINVSIDALAYIFITILKEYFFFHLFLLVGG